MESPDDGKPPGTLSRRDFNPPAQGCPAPWRGYPGKPPHNPLPILKGLFPLGRDAMDGIELMGLASASLKPFQGKGAFGNVHPG